jgi:hypothetical protein
LQETRLEKECVDGYHSEQQQFKGGGMLVQSAVPHGATAAAGLQEACMKVFREQQGRTCMQL